MHVLLRWICCRDREDVMVLEGQTGNGTKIQTLKSRIGQGLVNHFKHKHTQTTENTFHREVNVLVFPFQLTCPLNQLCLYLSTYINTRTLVCILIQAPNIAPVMHTQTCCRLITADAFPPYKQYLHISHLGNYTDSYMSQPPHSLYISCHILIFYIYLPS